MVDHTEKKALFNFRDPSITVVDTFVVTIIYP